MFLITLFEKSLITSGSTLKTPLASCSKRLPNEQCGFILSHLQRSLSLIIVNNGALGDLRMWNLFRIPGIHVRWHSRRLLSETWPGQEMNSLNAFICMNESLALPGKGNHSSIKGKEAGKPREVLAFLDFTWFRVHTSRLLIMCLAR